VDNNSLRLQVQEGGGLVHRRVLASGRRR
jgi:hypothetical protein